jgi:hypothetical protein
VRGSGDGLEHDYRGSHARRRGQHVEGVVAFEAVDAAAIQRLAGQLFHDDVLRLAAVAPARYLRGLDKHLRLPG